MLDLAKAECIHELFEAQADVRPDELALICGQKNLTYGQLELKTNQLAHYLRERGVGPGRLVGLFFERSELPIIALLAVFKAGGGYVPIDPVYPMERVRHILTDTNVCVLLTEQRLAERAKTFYDGLTILIDELEQEIVKQPSKRLSRNETGLSPSDLCYLIYTSGTTGRPKGIMTEHRNVVKFVSSFNNVCRLNNQDRIYQGFSLGFDGSVEEIWMAFSNGAALVVGTSEVVRLASEAARLITDQKVTFFSTVPTFLAMIDSELPFVRLLVVSGEQCPKELVDKWATNGRRMLNVYGPTETTVNTTAAECLKGSPISIGRPLDGYDIHILDDKMEPMPPGQPGELYIGGVGVARGYLNQPELTAKQFVENPFNGGAGSATLYRTGDQVRLNDKGELDFLGRIDSQVKIRGFRIELSEIESVLREYPAVHSAVVNVHEREGLKQLAAYVVLKRKDGSFNRDELYDYIHQKLPAYMVPGYLDVIEKMPTLASGKVNRKILPQPSSAFVRSGRRIVEPENEIERQLLNVWENVFNLTPISTEDDFFSDLSGYSLLAAQVVSLLRKEFSLKIAIRDIYKFTSIKALAKHLTLESKAQQEETVRKKRTDRKTSRQVFQSVSPTTRCCCLGLQAISLLLIYGMAAIPLVLVFMIIFGTVNGELALVSAVFMVSAVAFCVYPVKLTLCVAAKWLIIGRYKPGKYPIWSLYYYRWWLVTRLQALSGVNIFAGTPVMSLYYRMLGAKVGKNCIIDSTLLTCSDLVTIGDDTCIGSDTQLLGYRVEDGMLLMDTIEIGSRCFVGTHCALGLNTKMGDDAKLGDLSLIADGEFIAPGESKSGSPAVSAQVDLPDINQKIADRRHPLLFSLIHIVLVIQLSIVFFITLAPSMITLAFPFLIASFHWGFAAVAFLVAIPIHVIWFCLVIAGVKALVLGRLRPGVYPVESLLYLRKWIVDVLLAISRSYLHPLYTTIYLSPWLRLLGAKIGVRAEIATVTQITPDLIDIEDESFFADGSIIGGRRFFRGHVEFARNRIGRRSFVGNNAMLPLGNHLGDNCLLGVLSAPPVQLTTTPNGSEWLGAPSFQLPHRKKVDGFDSSVTFTPTAKLYVLRCCIDALRILIPYYIAAVWAIVFFALLYLTAHPPFWGTIIFMPPIAFGVALGAALSVVVLKKVLMPPFKPVIKPLWSPYVWLNEVVNGAFETIGAPAVAPLMGTPLISWYMRLMGCKIGKHVFLETALFSEFDLVDIGDYAALNLGVVVQNHLFEDRIMKSSYLRIGDECSVGNMSIVLYDTEMQQGACIGPLSLLMKGETLPPFSRWLGIPTSITENVGK